MQGACQKPCRFRQPWWSHLMRLCCSNIGVKQEPGLCSVVLASQNHGNQTVTEFIWSETEGLLLVPYQRNLSLRTGIVMIHAKGGSTLAEESGTIFQGSVACLRSDAIMWQVGSIG
jgi:hypothetical protein